MCVCVTVRVCMETLGQLGFKQTLSPTHTRPALIFFYPGAEGFPLHRPPAPHRPFLHLFISQGVIKTRCQAKGLGKVCDIICNLQCLLLGLCSPTPPLLSPHTHTASPHPPTHPPRFSPSLSLSFLTSLPLRVNRGHPSTVLKKNRRILIRILLPVAFELPCF